MNRRLWTVVAMLSLAVACGDDATSNNGTNPNNAANNALSGNNQSSSDDDWAAEIAGRENFSVVGGAVAVTNISSLLQIDGAHTGGASLLLQIEPGGPLMLETYPTTAFSMIADEPSYSCIDMSGAVTVTIDALEPIEGTFAGDVTCTDIINDSTDTFSGTVSGSFKQTF